ncbi:methyltransferase domain-containing protein [Pseudonocardiaceae bacterium YIM PH 21723]|nr:methyltransferase domain-containing protein [Pseudonocardiaceae bacterium YIM PH 21723]
MSTFDVTARRVQILDPLGRAYRQAFETFVASTDQVRLAKQYLTAVVDQLPHRRIMIDAGAGEGGPTRWLAPSFLRTIALEPDPLRLPGLRTNCPTAEVLPATIDQAYIDVRADLVLCCHVLYHLPRSRWAANVCRMLGWLAPEGELVIVLENPASDNMRMVAELSGVTLDLAELAAQLDVPCTLETVPSTVHTETLEDAVTIAQFVFGFAPLNALPDRETLTDYVRRRFADPAGGYTFTCTQDFLRLRRPGFHQMDAR